MCHWTFHCLRLGWRLSSFEPKCTRKGAHVNQVNFRKFWTDCVKFWHTFSIKRGWKNSWPSKQDSLHPSLPQINKTWATPDQEALFKGQNNQKLCLSFCHSLVSHLTSFFCTIYCIEIWSFLLGIPSPKHSQCIKPLQYLCWPCVLARFLLACCYFETFS